MEAEAVKAELQLLVGSAWEALETVRDRALSFYEIRKLTPQSRPAALTHPALLVWAELKVHGDAIDGVVQSAANPLWAGGKERENYYLQAAIQQLKPSEVRRNRVALVRLKQDPARSREWMALAFSLPMPNENLILAVVDPVVAFANLKRWKGQQIRGFVMTDNAIVLAHSQESYAGADFQRLAISREGDALSTYRAIDSLPVVSAFAKLGRMPIGVVAERVTQPPEIFSLDSLTGLGALLSLSLAFTGAFGFLRRRKPEVLSPALPPPFSPPLDLPVITAPPSIEKAIQQLSHSSVARSTARSELSEEHQYLLVQFEREVVAVASVERLAHRITDLAARVAKSPVLFFVYSEKLQIAILHTYAGFQNGARPPGMSFPVTTDLLNRVMEGPRERSAEALESYPPLLRLLKTRLATDGLVPPFEAWAVTSYLSPKFLGAMLVLESSTEARANHEPDLARLVRATGLSFLQHASEPRI